MLEACEAYKEGMWVRAVQRLRGKASSGEQGPRTEGNQKRMCLLVPVETKFGVGTDGHCDGDAQIFSAMRSSSAVEHAASTAG